MKSAEIRSLFLNYFKKNGHTVVESSGLVPQNDPTLLFTNAGMVQFKDVFLGSDPRSYSRAATSQKCLRAGGKHNDLENVGFTARHHTFFEMLGNFSFGDYFKKDAIRFAWEFVTKELKISKDRLYVSVFRTDDEAADIWHKQEGVPKERISRFDEKDNFWQMGETGPCGPCSEIFVDRGEKYSCGKPTCKMGCDCDRYMEIWNLVFMQFDRSADGTLTPLPRPSIDTGAGLERIASIIQDVDTNYDTDLFQDLIGAVSKLCGVPYGKSDKENVSLRVIADHCRATNFLIADGVLPSNEGRGYVLRRIMRRAIRYGRNLGFREPFFYKLTTALIKLMGDTYPELKDKREFLESTIRLEEERFLKTLDNGLAILEEEIAKAKKAGSKQIPGAAAFKLYDTFGFPLDLTQVIAREKEFTVDEAAFNAAMEDQRSRSRENWKGSGSTAVESVFKDLQKQGLKTSFEGYHSHSTTGKVLAIIEEGQIVKETSTGSFQIVVDKTPFYAEGGGQVGDKGTLASKDFSARVADVQKPTGDYFLLLCEGAQGRLKSGQSVEQQTDQTNRALTAKNHTATHMLHHALRKFLGAHVKQAGSLVTPEFLRFDFTHAKGLTDQEIEKIEDFINESIGDAEQVGSDEMNKDQAISKGAIAFFGDKYGDKVRVIQVGDYSTELCGGTHVANTAEIQVFKIVNENGIAAGVRRITAVTGPEVLKLVRKQESQLKQLMQITKASAVAELPTKIEKLQAAEKELRKALDAQTRKSAGGEMDRWISEAKALPDGAKFIRSIVDAPDGESPAKILRDLADLIRSKTSKSVVALGAKDSTNGRVMILVAVTKDLAAKYNAGDLIKKVAPVIDGSGGGKPDLAQAGGKLEKFNEAFQMIEGLLGEQK